MGASVTNAERKHFYLGIDAGTGSVRAGVFDVGGCLRAAATREIQTWRPQTDFVEQSSEDIWQAVGAATRQALGDAGASAEQIRGVGFDATCSLVVLDADDRPVTVSSTGRDEQNVIVWMDHRAMEQAKFINAQRHDVLRYVGGTISPEMQTPKLLWLRTHLPRTWARAAVEDFVQSAKEDTWVFGRLPGSPNYRRVIELAIEEAAQLESKLIGSEHLLLALLHEKGTTGQRALAKLGVTLKSCRAEILRQLGA